METIGDRVRLVRKREGLTMEKLGARIGISNPSVSTIESGKSNPSNQTVVSICREFGVSELWLRTGEGEMFVQRSMNQTLGLMVNDLMSEADESFRKRFVAALLELPEETWPEIEKFIKKISQGE